MKLERVITALGEEAALESLCSGWKISMERFPGIRPFFLDSATIRNALEYSAIDRAEHESVVRVAQKVGNDEALTRLAWHCCRMLYEERDYPAVNIRSWPSLSGALGAEAGYFYFLIALASVNYVRAFHREHGLPEDVTQATCADIWRFLPRYAGIRVTIPGTLQWLRHAAVGDLFKVGRHQYIRSVFRGRLLVFRHAADGDVIALSEPGCRYNTHGYCDGDSGIHDPYAWTATLAMDNSHVRGFPISPDGYAIRREVRLRLDEWFLIMVRDTPVLDMHIPPCEPMPVAESGNSMRRAADFFRRYLPAKNFRACACTSWLFNTQLQHILGENANITAWQREQYLYPVPAPKPAGLQFIFGFRPFDLATAPCDTRLRRGVVELMQRCEPLRNGAMFGLPEDSAHFGTQFYRNRWTRIRKRLGLPD